MWCKRNLTSFFIYSSKSHRAWSVCCYLEWKCTHWSQQRNHTDCELKNIPMHWRAKGWIDWFVFDAKCFVRTPFRTNQVIHFRYEYAQHWKIQWIFFWHSSGVVKSTYIRTARELMKFLQSNVYRENTKSLIRSCSCNEPTVCQLPITNLDDFRKICEFIKFYSSLKLAFVESNW